MGQEFSGGSVPWVIYSSAESQLLKADINTISNSYQQHIGYLGMSLKPFSFAWFHGGLKSKWTQTENLSGIYGEPAVLNIASGFTILKKYLYVSAGLRLPLTEQALVLKDSLEVSNFINRLNLVSEPNILPLNKVQLGMYSGFDFKKINFKLGATYIKPAAYEIYEGNSQFLGGYLSYKVQSRYIYKGISHNLSLNLLNFAEELDRSFKDAPAHQEGNIWQGMYQIKLHSGSGAMEFATGASFQQKDKNRTQLALDPRLKTESKNSNVQRYFLSAMWIRPIYQGYPLMLRLSPQLLSRETDGEIGYQSQFLSQYKFKAGKSHLLRLQFTGDFGSIGKEQILGAGFKIMYSYYGSKNFSARLYPQRVEE